MNALKIVGFTILVVAFYSYVGQMVPQQRTYPPETTELSNDMSTEEMVTVGQEIVQGKGTCLTCHAVGEEEGSGRFPSLGGIGAEAGDRVEGYSDIEYLAESLYEPNAHVVEGYNPAMPQVAQPPIDLNDQEIKAVIAYLQSLGGTPTITMDTTLRWESTGEESSAEESTTSSESSGPRQLFTKYLCTTCHAIDGPTRMVGPSFHDVGSRLSPEEIREAIMKPDATVREGFPSGTMKATLEGAGFYENVTDEELQSMVDFLAGQTGE